MATKFKIIEDAKHDDVDATNVDDYNYDDYNDFHEIESCYDEEWNDDMDGDFDSAMTSAGFGTDEDYGYFGDDTPLADDYGGE